MGTLILLRSHGKDNHKLHSMILVTEIVKKSKVKIKQKLHYDIGNTGCIDKISRVRMASSS
jgi:hypothetical protein